MKTRRLLRTVTKQDGLVDNEVWSSSSVAVGGDGTIYFGTAKGVAYYRPPLDRANDIPPIPQLHRASLVEDLSGNEILFEYAALSFSNERLVRYRTRLAGYDRDWSPENRDVKIRYTNLTTFLFPKEYSFEIRACNNSGVWTDAPLKYSFSVQPLWWFRWWAVGSYLLALGAGLFMTRQLDLRRQLKKAENERRVKELEEARALQLSMLPNDIPQLPQLEIAVYMKTASEVGGDYYDFYVDPDGTLTVAIGDATGHGLNAGMVVTATKSLFRTFALQADLPAAFNHANEIFRSMNLRKLYMALAILRVKEYRAQLCAAGMPPLLIRRGTTNTVEEHLVKGMPIGSVAKFPYQILEFDLVPGDALVLMSDGLPERFNGRKEMLGYDEAKAVLEGISDNAPQAIIQRYLEVEQAWSEGQPQDDDITFIVLRVKDGKANAPADTDKNAVRQ